MKRDIQFNSMSSPVLLTLAILNFYGNRIVASAVVYPSLPSPFSSHGVPSNAPLLIGDKISRPSLADDPDQLVNDLEEIAGILPFEDKGMAWAQDDKNNFKYLTEQRNLVKHTDPKYLQEGTPISKYDEPEYDFDVIEYDGNDRGESTDELLHRLLKDHEAQLTYKLVGEDSDDDNDSSLDKINSIDRNIRDVKKGNAKRTKKDQTQQVILKAKKDIETWLHQADPSLTVRELPTQPKISFRKSTPFNTTKIEVGNDENKNPNDVLSPRRRGMKEEVMDRPAVEANSHSNPRSPFSNLFREG